MPRGLVQSGGRGQMLVSLDTYWWIREREETRVFPQLLVREVRRREWPSWASGELGMGQGKVEALQLEHWRDCSVSKWMAGGQV